MSDSRGSLAHQIGAESLPSSLSPAEWVFTHARRAPRAPAVASPTHRLTYADLADRVRTLAGSLAEEGVVPGTRVLAALPNSPATIVAGLALNLLGATALEIGRDWSATAFGEVLDRAEVGYVFVAGRDVRKWGDALTKRRLDHVWVLNDDALDDAMRGQLAGVLVSRVGHDGTLDPQELSSQAAPVVAIDPDAPALVLYTSGSLGRPSGVIQTFRNIDANSRSIVEYLGLGPTDRAMLTLPLHYCYGRSVLQTHLLVGGSIFLDHRMSFPRTVLEAMATEGCTGFAGVPLTFEVIKRQVDVSTISLPHLRYITQAGGAMADETIDWVRREFSPARLFVMYGQTEATARLSYLPPERAGAKQGSIGIAIPGVEIRVVDRDGVEMPAGSVGEIIARGPNVTPGYLDDPASTAQILRDGWLWTGDLGERDDDGFLYHRGRDREILKVGGQRVSPVEIEQVMVGHQAIAEVVVIGQSDALLGEVPVAVVVPSAGVAIDEDDLRQFCQANLAPRQVPARIAIAGSLPRNAAGKLLRAEVARLHGDG